MAMNISLNEWLLIIGTVGGCAFAIYKKYTGWTPPPVKEHKDLSFASPYGWASFETIENYNAPRWMGAMGVFLGQHQNPYAYFIPPKKEREKWGDKVQQGGEFGNYISTEQESNTLLTAPAGSGKGRNVIINTLLKTSGLSVFTIDPKGENCAVTVRERLKMGQRVHVLNPWGLHGIPSKSLNPLDLLDAQDPAIVSNANFLTDLIMLPGETENFWDNSAKTFIRGLLLYVALKEPPENKNLARFFEILNASQKEFEEILTRMAAASEASGVIRSAGNLLISAGDRTRPDIIATAKAHCDFLNDPTIRASLTKSDFSFSDLKNALTTIYVIIPAYELETQGRWLRLMVGMAITAMQRGDPFKHRCLFLLDEFAALGRLEPVRQGVALHRGFGIDYCLVVQDLNQLQELYKNGWQTIMSNCRFKYFKSISDIVTAEYVSKLLGNKTVWADTENPHPVSRDLETGSRSRVGMPLRSPDELLRMDPEEAIVIREGENPLIANACPYDLDERTRRKADPNPFHTRNYKFPESVKEQLRTGRAPKDSNPFKSR